MEQLELNEVIRISGRPAPVVATAIHDGHFIRPDLLSLFALTDSERLREEDPFTAQFTAAFPATVTGLRSRFEFDLNRSPESAVYKIPADAWGLNLYSEKLPDERVAESLAMYKLAYDQLRPFFAACVEQFGAVIVLDIHSYNHQREGKGVFAAQEQNPDVNLGTANLDRGLWAEAVELLTERFSTTFIDGKRLDVRENIKFKGGYFSKWLHSEFGEKVCAIAVEFKKIFMDEWTGELNAGDHAELKRALTDVLPELELIQQKIAAKLNR